MTVEFTQHTSTLAHRSHLSFCFQTNFWFNCRWKVSGVMNLYCIFSLKKCQNEWNWRFPHPTPACWTLTPDSEKPTENLHCKGARWSTVLSGGTWSVVGLCLRGRTSVWANVWWSRDSGAGAQLNHRSPFGFILVFCFRAPAAHTLHFILYIPHVLGSIVGSK